MSKKTFIYILLACIVTGSLTSCAKEYSIEGGNVQVRDYYPTTTGTFWVYEDDNTGDTFTMEVKNSDTIIAGKTFRFIQSDNTLLYPDLLIAKQPGLYFSRSKALNDLLGTIGGAPLPINIPDSLLNREETILKDNVANGSVWNHDMNIVVSNPPSPLPPIPITITLAVKYTITEKAVTKTINGINFPDVITVKTDVTAMIPLLGNQDVLSMKNTYARGVGPVKQQLSVMVGTPVTTGYSIRNYRVNP